MAKFDAMMSSITHEMEADSSLAASVVTAFLQREHARVEHNPSDYAGILQVIIIWWLVCNCVTQPATGNDKISMI